MQDLVKRLIALITPLGFITAVVYLYVYWGRFGINAFEYLAFSELVVFSIKPIIAAVIIAGIYSLIGSWIFKIGETKLQLILIIISLSVCNVFVASFMGFSWGEAFWKDEHYLKYFYLMMFPTFVAIIVAAVLVNNESCKSLSDNSNHRFIIIALIVFLPLQAAGYGMASALAVKRGDSYYYIESSSFTEKLKFCKVQEIPYIGKLGNYFFFWRSDQKTVIVTTYEKVVPFELRSHKHNTNGSGVLSSNKTNSEDVKSHSAD
jgi:hypothetical protein